MKHTSEQTSVVKPADPSCIAVLPKEDAVLQADDTNNENLSPEPSQTAQYHQVVRITLNPILPCKKRRVFLVYRSKFIAISAAFRKVDNHNDVQDWILSGVKPRIFEFFFHWVNTFQLEHADSNIPTMTELSDLWKLGERLETARLQNQIMDQFCTLHNEKRLNPEEFGKFKEHLHSFTVEHCKLSRFLELVMQKYPDWHLFNEMLKDEAPRRRWFCLNLIWGDGSGREDWEILPDAYRLYVREYGDEEEDLIEL